MVSGLVLSTRDAALRITTNHISIDMQLTLEDQLVFSVPLYQAALIATFSAYESGKLNLSESDFGALLENGHWKPFDQVLAGDLTSKFRFQLNRVAQALISSIKQGSLRTDAVAWDLNNDVVAEATWLDLYVLREWLSDRDIEMSYVGEQFIDKELDLLIKLENIFEDWRTAQIGAEKTPAQKAREELRIEFTSDIEAELMRLRLENAQLRRMQKSTHQDRPVSTRMRENLLRLVAVMNVELHGKQAHNYYKCGQVLELAATRLGVRLGEDTIAERLREGMTLLPHDSATPRG